MKKIALFLFFVVCSTSLRADNYQLFEENGKIGIKDTQGAIILPAAFDALGWSDGSFSIIYGITGYRKQGHWGLIHLKKQYLTDADFENLTTSGSDRIIASRTIKPFVVKFGCLDLNGKVVIPFVYDAITIHGLHAVVMQKNAAVYKYGLIDLDNRPVIAVQYKMIQPIGSLRYTVENFQDKKALCSESGKWVTDFVIDSISLFQHDLAILYKGSKRGVIDRNGEIRIEALYRDVRISDSGEVSVRKSDAWKILNERYQELAQTESDDLIFLSAGWAKVTRDRKCGLVDENFQVKWPLEYQDIQLAGNLAVVKQHGKFRLHRMDRSDVLGMEFDSLCVDKNLVRARLGDGVAGRWMLYDTFAIRKTPGTYEFLGAFNGKFFPARKHGFWGGVNRYGEEVIACVYDSLLEVRGDLCVVLFKKQFGIIDVQDHWVLAPQQNEVMIAAEDRFIEKQDSLYYLKDFSGNIIYFTSLTLLPSQGRLIEKMKDGTEREVTFQGQTLEPRVPPSLHVTKIFRESEGLIGIRRDEKFGFVDNRGRLRVANRYEGIGEFHEGLSPAKLLGKWGYINKDDEIIIQPTYQFAENFESGIAKVYANRKAGLIDLGGKVVLELRYDSIRRLPNKYFVLTQDSRKGLAGPDGQLLIEPRFDQLILVDGDRVIVRQNNRFGILTTEGMSILPLQYDRLEYWSSRKAFIAKDAGDWQSVIPGKK